MDPLVRVQSRVLTGTPLTQVFVEVESAAGLTGTGEAWWGIPDRSRPGATARPIAAAVDDILAPRAVGRDSREIERLWWELWDYGYRYADGGIFTMALSGLDLALWDLFGKRCEMPVVQLLGGPVHDSIPGYASLPPLRDPEAVSRETRRALEAGLKAVKLHELEASHVRRLRDEFGPDLGIMVDVNGHFSPLQAIALGRELDEYGVLWFEEPVRPMRDHAALARVNAAIRTDLAAGENEYSLDDFHRLLSCRAISFLQPEITKVGGLTPARRISALAELHNVALCPHNFRAGPSLYASIHWGFASPATRWIEVPWLPEGVSFASETPLPPLDDGNVLVPEGPGFGL